MIDVAYVCHIRPEFSYNPPQSPPRVSGIYYMSRKFRACKQSKGGIFEIDVGQKVPVVGSGLAARIRHREKCNFVSLSSHQVHELEHVNLSAAERKVVFIAVEDSHRNSSPEFG